MMPILLLMIVLLIQNINGLLLLVIIHLLLGILLMKILNHKKLMFLKEKNIDLHLLLGIKKENVSLLDVVMELLESIRLKLVKTNDLIYFFYFDTFKTHAFCVSTKGTALFL